MTTPSPAFPLPERAIEAAARAIAETRGAIWTSPDHTVSANFDHDAAVAALTAALDGMVAQGWQPIASAPRDREILGLMRPKVIRLVWWFKPSHRSQGQWLDENGKKVTPKYWAPLPAPAAQGE